MTNLKEWLNDVSNSNVKSGCYQIVMILIEIIRIQDLTIKRMLGKLEEVNDFNDKQIKEIINGKDT